MSAASSNFSVSKTPAIQEGSANSARKRMVVVDDSNTILHMICTLLEHHNLAEVVGTAENGLDAIEMVKAVNPDLVLIDAELPEMSGLRTSLVLSQMQPDARIILMTMDPEKQFLAACAGCGAHAVIYKPRFLHELALLLGQDLESQATLA